MLVTGTPRSGTTWVGRMLAASGAYHYLHEPFNPSAGVGRDVCAARFDRYFTHICADNEAQYLGPLRDLADGRYLWWNGLSGVRSSRDLRRMAQRRREFAQRRRNGVAPLVKDPIALLSAGWLAERLDFEVLVMVRHPAAYAASMRRLGWGFAPRNWALSQPSVMRDWLEPYRDELEALAGRESDLIDQSALAWKVLNHIVLSYQERHADWVFLRHEDLAADPIAGFRQLYQRLALDFTPAVEATIVEHSAPSNPATAQDTHKTIRLDSRRNAQAWREQLSADDIERIRACVEPVASRFYRDSDW